MCVIGGGRQAVYMACATQRPQLLPCSVITRMRRNTRRPSQLKEFALSGYKTAQPMPFHKSPVSAAGRMMGVLHSFPVLVKRGYAHLKVRRSLLSFAGPLSVGRMGSHEQT